MIIKVPYSHLGGLYYPLIPITLKDILSTVALVDSGASFSVFKKETAHILGIKIENGRKMLINSITGSIPLYIHRIPVEIACHRFRLKVGFSDSHTASVNILGRDNFFNEFNVSFDERNKTMVLRKNQIRTNTHKTYTQ